MRNQTTFETIDTHQLQSVSGGGLSGVGDWIKKNGKTIREAAAPAWLLAGPIGAPIFLAESNKKAAGAAAIATGVGATGGPVNAARAGLSTYYGTLYADKTK